MGTAVKARPRAGRPTHTDAKRKSEILLGVATDLFVERGFNGTTMEAIALAAGIGKQAVYLRYPDKETLFSAVIRSLEDDDSFPPLPSDDELPLREGLRRRIVAVLTECQGSKATLVCKLALREGHRFPDLQSLLRDATFSHFVGPLAAYLEHCRQDGKIRDIDPVAIAAMCIDMIFAETIRTMFRETPLSTAQIDQCADRIGDLVLRGVCPLP